MHDDPQDWIRMRMTSPADHSTAASIIAANIHCSEPRRRIQETALLSSLDIPASFPDPLMDCFR